MRRALREFAVALAVTCGVLAGCAVFITALTWIADGGAH